MAALPAPQPSLLDRKELLSPHTHLLLNMCARAHMCFDKKRMRWNRRLCGHCPSPAPLLCVEYANIVRASCTPRKWNYKHEVVKYTGSTAEKWIHGNLCFHSAFWRLTLGCICTPLGEINMMINLVFSHNALNTCKYGQESWFFFTWLRNLDRLYVISFVVFILFAIFVSNVLILLLRQPHRSLLGEVSFPKWKLRLAL